MKEPIPVISLRQVKHRNIILNLFFKYSGKVGNINVSVSLQTLIYSTFDPAKKSKDNLIIVPVTLKVLSLLGLYL